MNNTDKFSGKADFYAKYRPSYPDELINYLYNVTQAKAVADIGAGTGIFTACLLEKPWKVTAVEPNKDMRSQLKKAVDRRAEIIDAPAEATTLAEKSVDLITVAQAFHWFDKALFKSECKRILTAGGKVAIVWNTTKKCEIISERDELMKSFCEGFRTGHTGKLSDVEGDAFLRFEYFSECEYTEYYFELQYTLEAFLGDNFSRSYCPKEGEPNFMRIKDGLTDIFNKYAVDYKIAIPLKTTCYLGKL